VENVNEKGAASPDGNAGTHGTVQETTDNILKEGETQKVYLTFDDGPSEEITSRILDILRRPFL